MIKRTFFSMALILLFLIAGMLYSSYMSKLPIQLLIKSIKFALELAFRLKDSENQYVRRKFNQITMKQLFQHFSESVSSKQNKISLKIV